MKIKIDEIKRYFTDYKTKQPLISQYGKPYASVTVVSGGTKYYLSDYNNSTNDWNVGTEIDVEVQVTDSGYNKIILPKIGNSFDALTRQITELKKENTELKAKLGIPTNGAIDFRKKDTDFKGISQVAPIEDEDVDTPKDFDNELPF